MPLPLRSCVIKGRSTKSRSNNGQSKEDSSSRVDQSGCEAIEDNGESQSGRCQNIQVAEANAGRNAGNGFEAGCIPIDAGLMSHRTGRPAFHPWASVRSKWVAAADFGAATDGAGVDRLRNWPGRDFYSAREIWLDGKLVALGNQRRRLPRRATAGLELRNALPRVTALQ
jgi:hypothetical protein